MVGDDWREEVSESINQDRLVFEANYQPLHPMSVSKKLLFERDADGGYAFIRVQGAWEGWQAARATPQGENSRVVGEAGYMPGTEGFTMACFKAVDVPAGSKLYVFP